MSDRDAIDTAWAAHSNRTEVDRLKAEIERLRIPAELVEKASTALNSTFAYDSKMVLRDILAWHESLKEGKE